MQTPADDDAHGTLRPALRDRLYRRLGFRPCWAPEFDDAPDHAGYLGIVTHIHLSLADRLRVMFGGPLMVATGVQTSQPVTASIVVDFSIMAPAPRRTHA